MKLLFFIFSIIILTFLFSPNENLSAQTKYSKHKYEDKQIKRVRNTYMVWEGTNPVMKASELAAYCAPIFWFSADEPELHKRSGKNIRIPTNFPFESKTDSPVVYYQITYIMTKDKLSGPAYKKNYLEPENSIIDLSQINAFDIYYSHFYKYEAGLGSHMYDTEQAQFQFLVESYPDSLNIRHYVAYFIKVTAKAHALDWYDNIFEIDSGRPEKDLSLPFHILVEEGKHASCSDMNGDGYYTPGYDVNVRKNDAWGVRDVIRGGELFSSDFQSWMAKVRRPEFRVFPPLPKDSPLRKQYTIDSVYAPDNAVYQLRPMPSSSLAETKLLKHDMESYYYDYSPDISKKSSHNNVLEWFVAEDFINSLGISYRADETSGIALCFPLLVIKNVEAPLIGGWLVNRVYVEGEQLNDFGYNILYTPSASRFLDPYISAGIEVNNYFKSKNDTTGATTDFAFETGIKIRGNVTYSPLKFLRFLSPFWGIRLGIKNKGFMAIDHLNYVIEIGAGVW